MRVRRGGFDLDLDVAVAPHQVVALLGPNGAGKSTALQALAGLVPLTDGAVAVGDRRFEDTAGRLRVPAERRGVGMVFQDYLLFPHLTARDNVAFGLRARGVARRTAHAKADAWLERVGLIAYARSRPGALSGGQAQRVALARALVVEPDLLLLDEPLAALDAGTRIEVRAELRHHLADFAGCTVLVTHDPLDAMVLADRIVVVEHGRAVQSGAPSEVARSPRTDYVARLVGLNLLRGKAKGHGVALECGGSFVTRDTVDGSAFVAFSPTAVALHRSRPDGSARNVWHGRVVGLEQHADTVRVQVDGPPPVLADVTTAAVAELDLTPGAPVWVAVKATEVSCYPA
ncbi:MAG: ATP-binding cassette domain-containing protein [Propionibacteriales bacterium]|nr:ATP-binding cassette domain-containing protein [Propionibacteriales bacterium]